MSVDQTSPMHFFGNEEALAAHNAHELAQEEVKPDLKQATSKLQLKEKEPICNVKDAIIISFGHFSFICMQDNVRDAYFCYIMRLH